MKDNNMFTVEVKAMVDGSLTVIETRLIKGKNRVTSHAMAFANNMMHNVTYKNKTLASVTIYDDKGIVELELRN